MLAIGKTTGNAKGAPMNNEMFNWQFKHTQYIPYDPSVDALYTGYTTHPALGGVQPFEYTGWRDEMLAAYETCYIHAGLNPAFTYRFKGADAMRFLEENLVNGFKTFEVGKSRHGIMVNEDGLLMSDGMLLRIGEDEFTTYWLAPYLQYKLETGDYDCEGFDETGEVFMFQLGGPRSLEIVEAATEEDFHDLPFLNHRTSSIDGMDVRIIRIGMAGSLAYEVHGKLEDSQAVYAALLKYGEKYGIKRLGRHAYWNTHTEGGFPQFIIHFPYAWEKDAGFMKWMQETNCPMAYYALSLQPLGGSLGADPELRYVNPVELGWGSAVKFDHDFVGKDALAKIVDGPHRVMTCLEWNDEDVVDVWASQFSDDPYEVMDQAEDYDPTGKFEYRAEKVVADGKTVGVSTGRIFNPYYHKMISLCTMEAAYAEEGTEVEVVWGAEGSRQKLIRAKVTRYPYHSEGRNDTVDVNAIPRGTRD